MKQIELTADIAHEGLVEGDVISVDALSAASLIKAGKAKEYEPPEAGAARQAGEEEPTYGGQPAATIDDIVDPGVEAQRGVMTVSVVAAADHGRKAAPVTGAEQPPAEAEPAPPSAGEPPAADPPAPHKGRAKAGAAANREASGAEPVGGDADAPAAAPGAISGA